MKAWIPNAITLLNLLCGCAAVVCVLDHRFMLAFYLLVGAGFFDFADGLVARLLNVSSEHGKELDSLADMVSFGFVPGVIYYVLLDFKSLDPDLTGVANTDLAAAMNAGVDTFSGFELLPLAGFLVTLFSALRLAKFNLDTRQTEDFIGLATPSSTVFATGLLLIFTLNPYGWAEYVLSWPVLIGSILLMSYLLVAEIPMFSFKLKGLGWRGNEIRFIFAASAVILLAVLQLAAFPFIIAVYLILNVANWLITRNRTAL